MVLKHFFAILCKLQLINTSSNNRLVEKQILLNKYNKITRNLYTLFGKFRTGLCFPVLSSKLALGRFVWFTRKLMLVYSSKLDCRLLNWPSFKDNVKLSNTTKHWPLTISTISLQQLSTSPMVLKSNVHLLKKRNRSCTAGYKSIETLKA